MTVTVNGTTGISLVQDSTITSAKIVDGTIVSQDLAGGATGNLTQTQANQNTLPGTATVMSYTHGLGVVPANAELEIVCLTAELGYAVGDVVTNALTAGTATIYSCMPITKNTTAVKAITGSVAAWAILNLSTGVLANPTAVNWAWRFKVRAA